MIHFNMDRKEALSHMTVDQKDALITIASRWHKVEVIGYPTKLTPYVSVWVESDGTSGKMFLGVESNGYTHS